jgi:hypothetical protein
MEYLITATQPVDASNSPTLTPHDLTCAHIIRTQMLTLSCDGIYRWYKAYSDFGPADHWDHGTRPSRAAMDAMRQGNPLHTRFGNNMLDQLRNSASCCRTCKIRTRPPRVPRGNKKKASQPGDRGDNNGDSSLDSDSGKCTFLSFFSISCA